MSKPARLDRRAVGLVKLYTNQANALAGLAAQLPTHPSDTVDLIDGVATVNVHKQHTLLEEISVLTGLLQAMLGRMG